MSHLPHLHTLHPEEKEIVLRVHWPDHVEYGQGEAALDTRSRLEAAVSYWKSRFGVERFYWRVDHWFIEQQCLQRQDSPEVAQGWSGFWERLAEAAVHSLDDFVQATHANGARAYLYLPFLDEGLPENLLYRPRGTPYPYQSHFSQENPQFLEVDRSGEQPHWGVLCYAYEEVRQYRLQILQHMLAETSADGLHLCTRSYVLPAEFGDQYGFNEPIVEEYQQRYGVDILKGDFDLESWRKLRGEYLTQFLDQVKNLLQKGRQRLSLAVPRGHYLGPPYGNLYLNWQQWVREGRVDELVINVISGRQLTEGLSGYGYLCNPEEGVGMNPLSQDLGKIYGPVCREAGCALYLGAGVDLNRHEPNASQLRQLAQLAGFDGFVFTTGNLGERFSFDKRGRPISWRIEDLFPSH